MGGISEIDLTINGTTFATLTTDPTDITVENSASTEIGSKVGSNYQIADSTVTVKNSENTTIHTEAVPAETNPTITITDSTAVIKNSAGTTIATESIPAEVSENITIADTTATAKNSANTTLATAAQVAGVATTLTIPDITKTDSDGTTSSVPAGVNVTCTPQVKDVFIKGYIPIGLTQTDTYTIDSDSAGTYTDITNDGASGTITLSKNGAAFAAFSNPTSFAVSDTIAFKRTTVTAIGWVKITGTYV